MYGTQPTDPTPTTPQPKNREVPARNVGVLKYSG